MADLNALPLPDLFETLCAGPALDALLATALAEDLRDGGDPTSESIIEPRRTATGRLVAHAEGIVAGLPAVRRLLGLADGDEPLRLRAAVEDGSACRAGETLAQVRGSLQMMLRLERTMLNLLGHLGGVATMTRRFVDAVHGTGAVICDTRKTLPGLRTLQKYAVRCGGGTMHRLGLSDALLYKDNHLAGIPAARLGEVIAAAIGRARTGRRFTFVEVEVDAPTQLESVLALEPGLVDIVLLDNMSVDELRAAVRRRDELQSPVRLEASGGVTLRSVRAIAETGVDRIAVGALTHSAAGLDLGLDVS